MIQSMTGYGKATAELSDKKINVEIKSLNSKAMDLSTRIAPLYREKEIEIRNEIAKALERGKVDFSLWIDKKDACELITPINQDVVVAYYERIRTISETTGIPVPEDWFSTLLRMPDVLTRVDIQELSDEEWEVASKAIEEALQHLVDFRKQEGAALEKKFTEKVDNIERLLKSIEPFEKERVAKIRERITDALEKTISVDYDKNRLEQELILTHYRRPMPGEKCMFITNSQILCRINSGIRQKLSPVKIGMVLKQEGFESMRSGGKRGYRMVELTGDEIQANLYAMGRYTEKPES